MNNNKGVYIIIGFLLFTVAGLSIAFAALSTSLNINFGNVTQTRHSWNVHFKPVSGLAAQETKTSTTGFSCGTASTSSNKLTVTVTNTQLSKPDDKCVWALEIQNEGTIDASLATITAVQPTSKTCTISGASMICGNVTYKLTTDAAGNTPLTLNSTVSSSSNLPVYLVAMYNDSTLDDSINETQSSAGFTLIYNQK